jgi:hypothetical protein
LEVDPLTKMDLARRTWPRGHLRGEVTDEAAPASNWEWD